MSKLKYKSCEAAVEFNDFEEVKKMVAADFDLSKFCIVKAAENGNLKILKFLYDNGCPFDWQSFRAAAINGHLDCLKFLVENGVETVDNFSTLSVVIDFGHFNCFKYLVDIGMIISDWMIERSFKKGHYHIFKFLLEKGLVFNINNDQFGEYVYSRARMNCLKLLYQSATNKAQWWLPCFDKWFNGFDLDDEVWRESFAFEIEVCPKLQKRIVEKKKFIAKQTQVCIGAFNGHISKDITQYVIAAFF
jgi:hypothetical protein